MLSNTQEVILKELERKWKEHPDLRFGQLISNIFRGEDHFYTKDKVMLEMISHYPSVLWQSKEK